MKSKASSDFDNLIWQPDRMLLEDLVFRLEHYQSDEWELGDDCFRFYKIKHLVDQYCAFWTGYTGPKPETILELGMFDGGSLAFWNEVFQPKKIVGIDLAKREDSHYFRRYLESRGLQDRVKTFWQTNQTDAEALVRIVQDEFDGQVDLVIDDGSHAYGPTKASLEILFPKLSPSGLYMIEDWAWAQWEECQQPGSEWFDRPAATKLIFELIEAVGSGRPDRHPCVFSHVDVHQGFAVVHKGDAKLNPAQRLTLDQHIFRGPSMRRLYGENGTSWRRRLRNRLRYLWKR